MTARKRNVMECLPRHLLLVNQIPDSTHVENQAVPNSDSKCFWKIAQLDLKKNRNMWFATKCFWHVDSLLVNAPTFVYLLRVSWGQPLLGFLNCFFFPVFTFYIARVLHNLAEIHTRVFMRKLKGVGKSKGKEKLERFASMKIYFGGYS